MKNILVLAVTVIAVSGLSIAQHDDHESHSEQTADGLELRLDNGGRWATDEPLRTGMADIHEAFRARHAEYQNDDLDREAALALADTVEDRVNFMFANCALPPAPDAELHKLLAAALGAAARLREEEDPRAGLHQLHTVLEAYAQHFDHPDWGG